MRSTRHSWLRPTGTLATRLGRWADARAGRVTCELAGPMPPYSFVDLELAAPEAAWA